MLKKLLILALLLSAIPALAQKQGQHWLEVRTPNFTVLTNSSDKDGRRTALQLERMRAVFHLLMPAASDDAAPIVVLALKDRKTFRTVEPEAYLAKNQLDLAGLFLRTQDRNYILLRLDAEGDSPFATVYHEYTHYMLRKAEPWMPLWLNEGLAEFYQNTSLEDKQVLMGKPSIDNIEYLRQNRLLPLATLLQVDHNSPYYHDEQKGSVFYAESWALTHYLEVKDNENHTSRLHDYSRYLVQHEDTMAAAQHAFGDLAKLESSLNSYIRQSNFKEFRLVAPLTFTETSFEVRPIPETEADAVRANVLLNVGRTKDSEALLQSTLAADPKCAAAHEIMGSLKFREGDLPAARKWYGEAVALDPQSYLANYYFGVISLQAGDRDHDPEIQRSLEASTKLNPHFAPPFDALAQFYASRHEKLDEAHMLNITAIALEPENLAYRRNTAEVLVQAQRFADAIRVLKTAQPLAKTPDETSALKERISTIETYQSSMEQAKEERARNPAPSAEDQGTVQTVHLAKGRIAISGSSDERPAFPDTVPNATRHTVSGRIQNTSCSYPKVLTFTVSQPAGPVALYTNNYFKLLITNNFDDKSEIDPCRNLEGMKVKVEYAEVTDSRVAGQILAVELIK